MYFLKTTYLFLSFLDFWNINWCAVLSHNYSTEDWHTAKLFSQCLYSPSDARRRSCLLSKRTLNNSLSKSARARKCHCTQHKNDRFEFQISFQNTCTFNMCTFLLPQEQNQTSRQKDSGSDWRQVRIWIGWRRTQEAQPQLEPLGVWLLSQTIRQMGEEYTG